MLVFESLSTYLDLLLLWNERTNLTAIRDPATIVQRHFGESIFAALHFGECETLLDFGSGAGFPGLPIQIVRTGLRVTLAESQNKKATFLREVVRTLQLNTEVWAGRVEDMPEPRMFDVVTLRAVDNMEEAVISAAGRAGSQLVVLTTKRAQNSYLPEFLEESFNPIPNTTEGYVLTLMRGR